VISDNHISTLPSGICTDGNNHRFQETGTIFTHHQKTVILDADAGNHRRKIVAFVGGLDLCGGRYDTPKHTLFRTLQTFHKEDYYNPNFAVRVVFPHLPYQTEFTKNLMQWPQKEFHPCCSGTLFHFVFPLLGDRKLVAILLDPHVPIIYSQVEDARGPREPWHDLHSKIDGPAAYDVLKNFEERWLKASKRSAAKKLSKLSRSHNDSLLWINKIPDIIAIDDEIYSNDDDPERWDVQVSLPKGSITHCKINNSDIHGRALSKFHLESRFSGQLIRILSRVFQKIHGRPLVR
jgi:hypothetical protein